MRDNKEVAEDSVVDFIDDEEYYEMRRNKQQIENATWAIYIFAVIASISYTFYLLMHSETFDWVTLVLNIAVIAVYFCLGAYSNQKPFTAFISFFCVLGFLFLLEMISSDFNLKGIVIKIIVVVYIAMRLNAARQVQHYENKNAKKSK